ncbi:MAG: SAM-dependent methyltransferase [Chloroflexota bacterium]
MSAPGRTRRIALRPHRWFAALYDWLNEPAERGPLGQRRAALIRPLSGQVLDLGAGTGANFPLYGAAARVVAVEPDPFMLRRAQRRRAVVHGARVDLCQAMGEALPFRDASFDAVVATLVLCTVADPQRTLYEARRVLRPDGRLYFLEHVRADGLLGRVQDAIRPVWSFFGGGCVLNRRTEAALLRVGYLIERLTRVRIGPLPFIVGIARPTALASTETSVYPGSDA